MGKKFKKGENRTEGQENVANGETVGHMGISKKSKKIKKQKDRQNLSKVEDVARMEAIVEHALGKRKQKAPRVEVEANVEDVVSRKAKFNTLEVKSDQTEQKPEKKQKQHKASAGSELEGIAGGTETGVKKSKKKKRKTSEVDTEEQPKKDKKKKHSAEGNGPAVVQSEFCEDKPHKKHKKKNKHMKNLDGARTEPQPKLKVKHNKHKPKAIEADKDVVTSESESEDELNDASNEMDEVNGKILNEHSKAAENESSGDEKTEKKALDKQVDEKKKEKRFTGPEHSIFIGNLPNTVKKSTMKSMFKQYGQILTVRFRSSDGVTLFKKKDWKQAKALNCYIRFETKEQAAAACVTNGQLVEGNRIRVTMHTQKQIGHTASTVFVGNINRKTTDNELYDFFSRVGEIEYVRQIADKGIGYVCFKKGVSIAKALKLNQQLLNGRPLRIVKADPAKQGKRKNKKGNLVEKAKFSRPAGPTGQPTNPKDHRRPGSQKQKPAAREFHGTIAKTNPDHKHRHQKKKGASDMKKKVLAQKLMAARASRK